VHGNRLRRSAPADVLYDGSGRRNAFGRNDCGRSVPAGLCR
jgi:hypothetical protein